MHLYMSVDLAVTRLHLIHLRQFQNSVYPQKVYWEFMNGRPSQAWT
jgi:hypothetical protein